MRIMKVLLGLTLLLANAIAAPRVKRVVGGAPYQPGDYPFHVSLWYMGENNFYTAFTGDRHHTCGGSLIRKDWVLTSSVCFDDDFVNGSHNMSLWRVVVGMHNQSDAMDDAQILSASKIFFLPDYNMTRSYGDLALLKLSEAADLDDDYVDTVEFNDESDCPKYGQECTVIGWGQKEENEFGNSTYVPHSVKVNIENTTECAITYSDPDIQTMMGNVRIDEGTICAGHLRGGKDACNGDSGSPLVCLCGGDEEVRVVGTVSTGFGCGRPGYSGIYTNVGHFADWIEDTIDNN